MLSNDEIDALLNDDAIESVDVEEDASDHFELVDFTNAHNKTLMSFPGYNALNELFALELGGTISKLARHKVQVQTKAPKLITYGDYIVSIEYPTSFNCIEFTNLSSIFFMHFTSKLLYILITYLFGGWLEEDIKLPPQLGKMEERITQRLIEHILETFQTTWSGIEDFEYQPRQLMLKPNPVNLLDEQDRLLVSGYNVNIGGAQCHFEIALETSLLERLKPSIKNNSARKVNIKEERVWRNKLYESLLDVRLDLITCFPDMKIKFEDLLNLKAGDIIALDDPSFVNVFVEEFKLYHASCGSSKGNRVIEILRKLNI